jgi:hypothetical protein
MRTLGLAVLLMACAVVGLVVAQSAFGSSIAYVDIDTTTQAGWRSTDVAKSLDVDGDNAYGTDGWMTANAVSDPSYATLALINGEPDGYYNAYMWVDQALTPAPTVADERANPYYVWQGPLVADLGQITMTANRSFRVALLGDIRADGDNRWLTTAFRIHQTTGGSADSGVHPFGPWTQVGQWMLFDITGVSGDVFMIEATAGTGTEADLVRVGFDTIPEPATLALLALGGIGLPIRRKKR